MIEASYGCIFGWTFYIWNPAAARDVSMLQNHLQLSSAHPAKSEPCLDMSCCQSSRKASNKKDWLHIQRYENRLLVPLLYRRYVHLIMKQKFSCTCCTVQYRCTLSWISSKAKYYPKGNCQYCGANLTRTCRRNTTCNAKLELSSREHCIFAIHNPAVGNISIRQVMLADKLQNTVRV